MIPTRCITISIHCSFEAYIRPTTPRCLACSSWISDPASGPSVRRTLRPGKIREVNNIRDLGNKIPCAGIRRNCVTHPRISVNHSQIVFDSKPRLSDYHSRNLSMVTGRIERLNPEYHKIQRRIINIPSPDYSTK